MKKLLSLLLAVVMVFGLMACGNTDTPDPTEDNTEANPTEASTSNGAETTGVAFNVVVTDLDGTETTFEYTSDAESVGAALAAEGLIEGHDTEYGLYVDAVNGITADWATENAYWAFYIDGEYAMTGVDATAITEGATYAFVKTISYTVLGEGATTFYVTVADVDGTVTKFQINTDAATVGEALVAVELVEGHDTEYGLYVDAVNGITADWDTEKAYWAFYINGEYAVTGVDATEIAAGTTYELVKTVSE